MQLIIVAFALIRTGLVSATLASNLLRDGVSSANELFFKLQQNGVDVRKLGSALVARIEDLCSKTNVYINDFAVNTCVLSVINKVLPVESPSLARYHAAKLNVDIVDPTGGLSKLYALTSPSENAKLALIYQHTLKFVNSNDVFKLLLDESFGKANSNCLFTLCVSALDAFICDEGNKKIDFIFNSDLGKALKTYANEVDISEDVKKQAVLRLIGIFVTAYCLTSYLSKSTETYLTLNRQKDPNYSKLSKEFKDNIANYPLTTYPTGTKADFESVTRKFIKQFITANTIF